jgi:hypothetical protein
MSELSVLLAVRWQPRQSPLKPVAVAACGTVALRLAHKLLAQDSLQQFEGVAGDQLLVLQGSEMQNDGTQQPAGSSLPWVDGVQYLGAHPAAPSLLLPTNYEPMLPGEMLEKVFLARCKRGEKYAVLLQPLLLIPMVQARAVLRAVLSQWLAEQKS